MSIEDLIEWSTHPAGIDRRALENVHRDGWGIERADHMTTADCLTRAEIRAEVDRAAREHLGMSGEEFFERWRAGDLDEFEPRIARLAVLARLLTD